jgi:hypothetical protein
MEQHTCGGVGESFQLKSCASQSEICTLRGLSTLASTTSQIEGTPMNTFRMFAFVAALLITASFFGVMADAFTAPQHASDRVAAGAQASGG